MEKRNETCSRKVVGVNMDAIELGKTLDNLLKRKCTQETFFELGNLIQYGYDQQYGTLPNGKNMVDYQIEAGKKWGELKEKENKIVKNNYSKQKEKLMELTQ